MTAARMPWLARLANYARQNGGPERRLKPGQIKRLRRKDRNTAGVAPGRP